MPRLSLPVSDKVNRELKAEAEKQHRSVISLLLEIIDQWLAARKASK